MKTGKKHYLKNYNFHEILTCLSHGYKNIGKNNILSLIKIYTLMGCEP
jgi:malate synthase